MFRSALIAAAFALTFAPLAALAQDDDHGRISITGTASVDMVPDLATVMAGVETVGPTARNALTENSARMNAVFSAIRALGIEDRDVGTSNFSISQNFRQGPNGSVPDGFRVSNRVTLRLRDISRVGEVLDALTSEGVNSAGNIRFEIENADALLDDARREAVVKARQRAGLYADAAGVQLGRVLGISEGGFSPNVRLLTSGGGTPGAPPIAPGERTLSASVTVTWSLEEYGYRNRQKR